MRWARSSFSAHSTPGAGNGYETTKLCAMIGKAVARRIPMGPTRAEAPERSGRRILIQDVHACHHARGELRVCQARIMHIQRRGVPHRCHVRAHAAFQARGGVRVAATLFAQRAATHFTFQTHDMRRIGELGAMCRVCHSAAPPRLAFASVLLLVSTSGLSRGNVTNSVGPTFLEAKGYKSKRTACFGTDTLLSVWANTY